MMPAGSVNAWQCDTCRAILIAIHVDDGVTPMFLTCRATDCDGRAVSNGYPAGPIPAYILENVGWEWHRPTPTQFKAWRRDKAKTAMLDHVRQGGLILRRLTDDGRAVLSAR